LTGLTSPTAPPLPAKAAAFAIGKQADFGRSRFPIAATRKLECQPQLTIRRGELSCLMTEIRSTRVFLKWLRGLRDARARARIQIRIDRMSLGNPGDVRPVGAVVSELRIDHGPDTACISPGAAKPS
jgi:hypothetical protein